jgi:hypothetical protein
VRPVDAFLPLFEDVQHVVAKLKIFATPESLSAGRACPDSPKDFAASAILEARRRAATPAADAKSKPTRRRLVPSELSITGWTRVVIHLDARGPSRVGR